jgi:hypothetical protein
MQAAAYLMLLADNLAQHSFFGLIWFVANATSSQEDQRSCFSSEPQLIHVF